MFQYSNLVILGIPIENDKPRPDVLEPLGREEVEQVEQLLQVVLQRGSSQQQLVLQRVVVQDPEKLKKDKKNRF